MGASWFVSIFVYKIVSIIGDVKLFTVVSNFKLPVTTVFLLFSSFKSFLSGGQHFY